VNGPTSGVSNGPGSRAKTQQLIDNYNVIIWDSGNLSTITISDGTTKSDKSNDCQMLLDWMFLSKRQTGLWVCGDGIAYDLAHNDASPVALQLLNAMCGVTLVRDSYYDLTGGRASGGVVNPLVTGDADAGVLMYGGVPDAFCAFGGCPTINFFDVLGKTENGHWALDYPDYGGTKYYAGIASWTLNSRGFVNLTMWFGFSFQYIRDDTKENPIDRFTVARQVFSWMQEMVWTGTDQQPAAPRAYGLAQNFPNPFNPSTTIRYDMKDKGRVSVKIYNVAGELVRTLVESVKNAGSYSIAWDGRNNVGTDVASGIYFCKMETTDFRQTRKMVVLK